MIAEEILKEILVEQELPTFNELFCHMDSLASKCLTVKLWIGPLVWPVFIAMRFIRSALEAD